MQKKILLSTDFSDNAWNSIIYGLKLFSSETCKFYILHAIQIKNPTMSSFSNRFSKTVRETAMNDLLDLKQMIERVNANANHSFEIILSTQKLKIAIESAVKKHQIEMVVMGTKGAIGAKQVFFGSNTVSVISKMRLCPILTVPDNFEFVAPKQIVFPTDFNRFFDEKELKPLIDIANLYNSKISILHINNEEYLNEVQKYNSKILKSYLKEYEHTLYLIPHFTKKTQEVNNFIKDLKINLLVLVNYKHSLIENITKEPIIKKIGFHPIVPFLVIPE